MHEPEAQNPNIVYTRSGKLRNRNSKRLREGKGGGVGD